MENNMLGKRQFSHILVECGVIAAIYVVSYLLNSYNHFFAGIFMIFLSVLCYIYYVRKNGGNFLGYSAIFSGVWLCTIGLAQMRFNAYQQPWQLLTWINVGLAHAVFLLGNNIAHVLFYKNKFIRSIMESGASRIPFIGKVQKKRLFWIAIITAVIGITCFLVNCMIKGFIPFFVSADNNKTYVDFYTRFIIFVVASMVSGGLSYYCLRKCSANIFQKLLLIVAIISLVFIIPLLMVQRGTFILVALIITSSIYWLHKRHSFILLVLCIVSMLGIYQAATSLRGYSDAQLEEFFEPQQVTIIDNSTTDEPQDEHNLLSIKLSPKVSFLYTYLTVSHDNFNCAVANKTNNSWGIRQLNPFNTILRSQWLKDKIAHSEIYLVKPYLNTYNLITTAYYDFGTFGVVFLTMLWSVCFGLVEAYTCKNKTPFSILTYGVCLIPVALCFFNAWMSYFTTWLLWGTVFLMYIASTFTFKKLPRHMDSSDSKTFTIPNDENSPKP